MVGRRSFPFGIAYFQGLLLLVSGSVTQVFWAPNLMGLKSPDVEVKCFLPCTMFAKAAFCRGCLGCLTLKLDGWYVNPGWFRNVGDHKIVTPNFYRSIYLVLRDDSNMKIKEMTGPGVCSKGR